MKLFLPASSFFIDAFNSFWQNHRTHPIPQPQPRNPQSTMKTEIAFKPVAVPLAVHAELTPNPKGIGDFPAAANVNAVLDGVVNADGKFVVNKFSANR